MPVIVSNSWDRQVVTAVANKMPPDKAIAWESQAGHMFFKVHRARYHFKSVESCYRGMIEEMPRYLSQGDLSEGLNSGYSGPISELLLVHLDGYFEAERSGHDFILACLRTAGLLPAGPSSFHDFYNAEQRKPGKFAGEPPDLVPQLLAFWIATGKPIKDYRDCLSHFISLSGPTWQHAVNMKWKSGAWHAALYLPDNPEVKSSKKFTYQINLDALALCARFNQQTEHLLRCLMDSCIEKWGASMTTGDYRVTIRNVHIRS